jgi:hypothetical protein
MDGWYFVVMYSNSYSDPKLSKEIPSIQTRLQLSFLPLQQKMRAQTNTQNLQQISPFLQPKRIQACLRSAFAILTGLLIHSLCNLFINQNKKII